MARTILLDQLTGRARTRRELADKLRSRNVPDDVATRLLDRFTEVGLIDDAAFARLWVESRQASRGLARRALADELRRKGVDAELVREAVDEVDPADEEAAARSAGPQEAAVPAPGRPQPPPPGGWRDARPQGLLRRARLRGGQGRAGGRGVR